MRRSLRIVTRRRPLSLEVNEKQCFSLSVDVQRLGRTAPWPLTVASAERGAAPAALDAHLKDGDRVDEAIDSGHGGGSVGQSLTLCYSRMQQARASARPRRRYILRSRTRPPFKKTSPSSKATLTFLQRIAGKSKESFPELALPSNINLSAYSRADRVSQ